MPKNTDTSNELHIYPWQNGIKLYRPDTRFEPLSIQPILSISQYLDLPFNVFFMNQESQLVCINDLCTAAIGYDSTKQIQNKSLLDLIPGKFAREVIKNDHLVMRTKRKLIEQENKDEFSSYLTVKMPWYNLENEVVGVFGCAVQLNTSTFASALTSMMELGLLNQQSEYDLSNSSHLSLTQKEINILYLIKFGKVAREISERLSISRRTVEHHIENIKNKLNVSTHSELIELAQSLIK